jgi:hypoxanthine phosphoribosyltransferase
MIFYLIYVVDSSKTMEEALMEMDDYDEQQIKPNALPFARRLVL